MKIIFNQECIQNELLINYKEKYFFSGNYVNAFCWLFDNKTIFWDDVYFQLMASMRKMRIDIPLDFTPEMFQNNIHILANELKLSKGTIRITVFKNTIQKPSSFIIEFLPYRNFFSNLDNEVDIYRELTIFPNLLSSTFILHPINNIASEYILENKLNDAILLNYEKRIARSIFGNIFLIKDNTIYSPPITEGAYISALKKNFILFLHKNTDFLYREEALSPFSTQSADELFILSDKRGLISITKNKNNYFNTIQTESLVKRFIGFSIKENIK